MLFRLRIGAIFQVDANLHEKPLPRLGGITKDNLHSVMSGFETRRRNLARRIVCPQLH